MRTDSCGKQGLITEAQPFFVRCGFYLVGLNTSLPAGLLLVAGQEHAGGQFLNIQPCKPGFIPTKDPMVLRIKDQLVKKQAPFSK